MTAITSVVGTTEFDDAVRADVPVVAYFTATWCGPCTTLAPIVEDLAAHEWAGTVKVIKVDADENPDILERFDVQGVPTLSLFEDGELLVSKVGGDTKQRLLELFDPYV